MDLGVALMMHSNVSGVRTVMNHFHRGRVNGYASAGSRKLFRKSIVTSPVQSHCNVLRVLRFSMNDENQRLSIPSSGFNIFAVPII